MRRDRYLSATFATVFVAVRALCAFAIQASVLTVASEATAANDIWVHVTNQPGYEFQNGFSWLDGSPPEASDSATFNQPNTYLVPFSSDTNAYYGGDPTINDLFVTAGNVLFYDFDYAFGTLRMNGIGGGNSIDISAGTLTTDAMNLEADIALFVQNGGTLNLINASRLDIGVVASIQTGGTVNVLGGSDLAVGGLLLDTSGGTTPAATLNVQGGAVILNTGGLLTVGSLNTTGTAAINIGTTGPGGVYTSTGKTTINKTGTITIGGSGNFYANGNVTVNGGVLQRNSSGYFNLAIGRELTVSNGGRATFVDNYRTDYETIYNVEGTGSRFEVGSLTIDNLATVNVNSGGYLAVTDSILIGRGGDGTLVVDGAGTSVSSSGICHGFWGANGYSAFVTISNNAFASFASIDMAAFDGYGGAAEVNVLSGGDLFLDWLRIADNNGGAATGTLNVQGSGSSVTQAGTGFLSMGSSISSSTATLNIGTTSGGATFTTGSAGVLINRRGTVNVGGISGAASSGLLNLLGDATVNGVVRVGRGGEINIAAGKILTLTPGDTPDDSGTLEGNGRVNGTVQNGGVVAPGLSVGKLRINGNYTQQTSGTLIMELASLADFDRLIVTQHAALNGQLYIQLAPGYTPSVGDSFDLIDWNTVSGSFNTFQYQGLPDGQAWDFSQVSTTGVVSVVVPNMPGDYNNDGTVDAADFTVWRDGLGTTYTPADYDVWKAHFGQSLGTGAAGLGATGSASVTPPVPEPSLFTLAAGTLLGLSAIARRRRPR